MSEIIAPNKSRVSILLPYIILIVSIVIIDQAIKQWAFHNLNTGESIHVIGDFFKLQLVQNPGMAFGISWDWKYAKLFLSIIRLIITIGLIWYFLRVSNQGVSKWFLICLAVIIAGAIGNGIDGAFYGVLLDNAPAGSPSPWFHGRVVDMFYFDIWKGRISNSIPLIGGKYYAFWPVFNISDAAVTVGVLSILIFQKRLLQRSDTEVRENGYH